MKRYIALMFFGFVCFFLNTHISFADDSVLSGHFSGMDLKLENPETGCERFYQTIPFTVTRDGTYNFSSIYHGFDSGGLDVGFVIYEGNFSTEFPADNVIDKRSPINGYEGPPVRANLKRDQSYVLLVLAPCSRASIGNFAVAVRKVGVGSVSSTAATYTPESFTSFPFRDPNMNGALFDLGCGGSPNPAIQLELESIRVSRSGQYQFISDGSSGNGVCVQVYTEEPFYANPRANLISTEKGWLRSVADLVEGQDYYLAVQPVNSTPSNTTDKSFFFVTAPTNDQPLLGSSMTGYWANPATPGQGFFIEVLEDSRNLVVMSWFTFDGFGPPLNETSQRWLIASGSIQDEEEQLVIYSTYGGSFNQTGPFEGGTIPVGKLQIGFVDCNTAVIDYQIDSGTSSSQVKDSGQIRVQRISDANSQLCFDHQSSGTAFRTGTYMSGTWADPATPGQGFFLEILGETGQAIVGWATYQNSSAPTHVGAPGQQWLTAQGPINDNEALLQVVVSRGGEFNSATPVPSATLSGDVLLEIFDCHNGQISFNFGGNSAPGVIPIQRISNADSAACQDWLNQPGIPQSIILK